MIVLEPLKNQIVSDEVFKLIRLGFVSPRKKLVANLAGILSRDELKKGFLDLGISLDARPADLELEDWKKLYEILYK